MPFFSPILYLLLCITSFFQKLSSFNKPSYSSSISSSLLHVPSKLGCYYDCLLIYEWFYNIYSYYVLSFNHSSYLHLYKKRQQQQYSKRNRYYTRPSLHHLVFFIYFLTNFIIAFGIHQDSLPISTISIMPSITCIYFLSSIKMSITIPSSSPLLLPTITTTSTNYEKLCYLTA